VRLADLRGYSYDRRDVTGRGLANAYAQTLGTIFSSGGEKPYEVEIFVAEVADEPADDQVYRLTYDGSVADEHGFAVMGGLDRAVDVLPGGALHRGTGPDAAIRLAVAALAHDSEPTREIAADSDRGSGARPDRDAQPQVQTAAGPDRGEALASG
jgi:proteasome alpha subunit